MKRVGGLWESVVAFEHLCRSARRAARGKRRVAGVARFLADLEPRVLRLQEELVGESWQPGPASTFRIQDPKERVITAAPFVDRVVHHAVIGCLEPIFERRMVFESFACRRGKGTHAAVRHARRMVRRYRWFLKMDVARCFRSLAPEMVIETLARVIKDRKLLDLCERIVGVGGDRSEEGAGLPIGNLTSQWFCNLALDRMDHWIKEELRVPGYVRYMDDFVLFAGSRERLRDALPAVTGFLRAPLGLRPKERATQLAPVGVGLPFLGWRIYRGTTRIRPENLRRLRARLEHRRWECRRGVIDEERLLASVRSTVEHLRHGNTLGLRRSWLLELVLSGGTGVVS